MSDYITDPSILNRLNSSQDEYVDDPALLARLNGEEAQEIATPGDVASIQAGMSAVRPATQAAMETGKFGIDTAKNIMDIGRNMANWTPQAWKEVATHPIESAKAYIQSMPAFRNAPGMTTGQMMTGGIGQMAGTAGRTLGSAVAAPENLFTVPYSMAAYEQEKIRANPQAPGLEYNPYAQVQRGEFGTQQQAAQANRRRAVAGQTYGGLNPQEQQMLDADRQLSYAIRLKAARKVLGQP